MNQLVWHGTLISFAALVCASLGFCSTNMLHLMSTTLRGENHISWQNAAIVAWTGMRGVVSLAAALAVPLTLSDGRPSPDVTTFCSSRFASFWQRLYFKA